MILSVLLAGITYGDPDDPVTDCPTDLLDAIRAGRSADVMREAMTLVLQGLIELEDSPAMGTNRYERTTCCGRPDQGR